jgi:hypothetical protein
MEPEPVQLRTETIFQDTKCTIGVPREVRWGDVYRMIRDQDIPDVLLEEEQIYLNIRTSGIGFYSP